MSIEKKLPSAALAAGQRTDQGQNDLIFVVELVSTRAGLQAQSLSHPFKYSTLAELYPHTAPTVKSCFHYLEIVCVHHRRLCSILNENKESRDQMGAEVD